jgi:hypothetical protein
MRDLADIHYPHADQIRVVMDNLSTHTAGALYEHSRHPKHAAFFSVWSFTTHPNMPVG